LTEFRVCIENNGGRRSELALVLAKWRHLLLWNWI